MKCHVCICLPYELAKWVETRAAVLEMSNSAFVAGILKRAMEAKA